MRPTLLHLELHAGAVTFPDGRPFCLICGGNPHSVRRVYFERFGSGGAFVGAIGAGIRAIQTRIEFEAPLCKRHYWRATLSGWIGVLMIMAGLIYVFTRPVRATTGGDAATSDTWLMILWCGWVGLGGWLWARKDSGGLPCDVSLESEGRLLLKYSRGVPFPESYVDPDGP